MFKDFPGTIKVKVVETSELVQMGGVQVAADLELKYLVMVLFVRGPLAGGESLRIRMFPDQAMALPALATSAAVVLSTIPNLGSGCWIGRLRFDFNREQMNKNTRYWLGIDAASYTRVGDTRYLGVVLDYAFGQVGQPTAAWMAPYGYRYLG